MSIPIRGMAPLLQVFDMGESLAFYRKLGFEVVASNLPGQPPEAADWVLLRAGGIELMLNGAYETPDRPAVPDAARGKAHQDTTLYFGCPEVDRAYEILRESNLEVAPPKVAPYGMKQLYLSDPDGYGICFQWPAKP